MLLDCVVLNLPYCGSRGQLLITVYALDSLRIDLLVVLYISRLLTLTRSSLFVQ